MAFQLTEITATPTYTTRSRSTKLRSAGQTIPIWKPPSIPDKEAHDGSDRCCTFKIGNSGLLPLTLSGSWPRLKDLDVFSVKGQLNGTDAVIARDYRSPKTADFKLPENKLQLFSSLNFPCRYAGDWSWEIAASSAGPWSTFATPTRLELNFVKSPPPNGPPVSPNDQTSARPQFWYEYPVDVFRLFLPNFGEPIPSDPRPWYFQRTMDTIWGLGQSVNLQFPLGTRLFQYEAIQGAPTYIDSGWGGTFQLRRFVDGLFDSLNCFDLAALSQLAICIILDDNGTEEYDSKWIYCRNYGYIPDGPLIGWPQFQNCNSPFFSGRRLPHYPFNSTDRQYFGTHAWVEVTASDGARTVLDATHCIQGGTGPASGTSERGPYMQQNIDLRIRLSRPWRYDWNPGTSLDQIGVQYVESVGALSPVPPNRPTMQASETTPINNAPCDDLSILQIVQSTCPSAFLSTTDRLVGSHGCQVLAAFAGIPQCSNRLFVEINNFESLSDALAEYEKHRDNLNELVDPESRIAPGQIGNQDFCTPFTLLWRRNLMCVRVFAQPPVSDQPVDINLPGLLFDTAKAIDAHLKANAVNPGHEARPTPSLKHPEQKKIVVKPKTEIEIPLAGVDDISDVCIAEIKDQSIIKQASVGSKAAGTCGAVHLIALKTGQTDVTHCVSHHSNLSIATIKIDVEVG